MSHSWFDDLKKVLVLQAHISTASNGRLAVRPLVSVLASAIAIVGLYWPVAATGQTAGVAMQAVVQPLPSAGVTELNTALRRLARNSRDVDALIDAGHASLKVNDVDAAIGFFGRAEELSPGNPRIKVGLAAAYTRQQRPLDALRLFDEAEQAGASTQDLAGDRGLAYDLVGDNQSAVQQYQIALSQGDTPEMRQRLAISHAIAGDREAFEATLAPLIAQQDAGSYRTRAFGLAILGDDAQAVAIAEAVMPRNGSARIAPYLRYMPRLTRAQQAAAVNLGVFPRAAQIGRDSPRVAQYTGNPSSRNADARLEPRGAPLGRRADTASQSRQPDQIRSSAEQETQLAASAPPVLTSAASTSVTPALAVSTPSALASSTVAPTRTAPSEAVLAEAARTSRAAASDPLARSIAPRRVRIARAETVQPQSQPVAITASDAAALPEAEEQISSAEPAFAEAAPADQSVASANSVLPTPNFDLAQVTPPAPTVSVAVESTPVVQNTPDSVADAFAKFSLQPRTGVPVNNGGVDISTIKPPREVVRETVAAAEKPAHPKRFWVQIATGKDRSGLRFDWRRISRKAPDILSGSQGYVTPWGESNRLLTGPYDSLQAARSAVTALKSEGVDSFTFTSPDGQEIDPV